MKNIIIAILIFSSAAFLTSCKKCAQCTMTTTMDVDIPFPGFPQVSTSTFEACGDDLKAVDGQTTTSTTTMMGMTASVVATTNCD